jgi:uncharacterized protein (TIGR02001 family)
MLRASLLLIVFATVSQPAFAKEDESSPALDLEATLSVVSDYRFRGVSLSDRDPALQGDVTATLKGGVYGSVWASTIDEYGAGDDGEGAHLEVDFILGWAGSLGGLDVDVSAQAYRYPGGSDVNYIELPIEVSKTVGDWRWTLGGAYAPSQKALGHSDNAYGFGAVAWSARALPLQLEVRAGYEDGAYAPGGKWDWSAGVGWTFGPVTAGLSYVDGDHASTPAGVVASLTASF